MKNEQAKSEINAEQYFVVDANTTAAIMQYLNNSPYSQVKDLVEGFGQSKRLKEFMKENKSKGLVDKS